MDHPSTKSDSHKDGKRPQQVLSVSPKRCSTRKRPREQAETTVEMNQNKVRSDEKITIAINANLLKCCACSGRLTVPLFQCNAGHVSCSRCCTDESLNGDIECLMCDETAITTHCPVMEHFLAGVHVPCPFRQHGCTMTIPYTLEQDHMASCTHAPYDCPIAGCAGYIGAGRSLRDHIREDHPGLARTRVQPGILTPLKMRAHEQARVVRLGDGTEFLVVVAEYMQVGRSLSVVHLVDESVGEQELTHKIEVIGKAGVVSLSGKTLGVRRLVEPYEASVFLFVPNEDWDSREVIPVSIEVR